MDKLYIILKHVVWRFRIFSLFCETYLNFAKIWPFVYFSDIIKSVHSKLIGGWQLRATSVFYSVKLCTLVGVSGIILAIFSSVITFHTAYVGQDGIIVGKDCCTHWLRKSTERTIFS